jgi:NAD(P)-dependent dehydrogenase (short-subunit alcohol dehydrogenase family)
MKRYQGKVALVTGGGSGLGEACVRRLAAEGARVAVLDNDTVRGAAVVESLAAQAHKALFLSTDVTRIDSVEAAVAKVLDALGALDLAVNSAGIGGPMAPILDMPQAQWHQTLAVNLTGVFHCMRAEIRAMVERGGAIVNMASVFGIVGGANVAAYTAAKHGIIGLTKATALEYGLQQVRINAVAPTFVRTPLTAATIDDEAWQHLTTLHALGRFPTPEDVAATVAWLGSDDASAVTGSVHLVDAGFTAA